jgi:hypothetical protein
MKKLGKLQINSEKLMKNEELTSLRGGYGAGTCCCWDEDCICVIGYLVSDTGNCDNDCIYAFASPQRPNVGGIMGNCGPSAPPC